MARNLMLLVLITLLSGCHYSATVVVRHAEKQSGGANVSLTAAGRQRAQALVDVIRPNVAAVYATDWCRTIQTAEPVALDAGVPIRVQPSSNSQAGHASCTPAITATIQMLPASVSTTLDLAAHIKSNHSRSTVLVVGHSNTVADLVAGLGGGTVDELPESVFDRMFLVTRGKRDSGGRLFVVRYGSPSGP